MRQITPTMAPLAAALERTTKIAIKVVLLSGCVLGFIVACSTPVHNYQFEVTPFSTPPTGLEMTARLGEHMLDQGIAVKKDVLYINKKAHIVFWTVKPGKFDKTGVDDEFEYYDESTGERVLIRDILGGEQPDASLQIDLAGQQVCVLHPLEMDYCGNADFTRRTEDSVDNRGFRRTLIYSGRVGISCESLTENLVTMLHEELLVTT